MQLRFVKREELASGIWEYYFRPERPIDYVPGQYVDITLGDVGDLILPKDPARPLVFIAGGIGIASYASMFKKLLAKREERDIYLFYAMRTKYEQIFKDLTNSYPLQLKTIVIAPNRLTAQQIVDSTPPDALIYLSGSQRFVEALRLSLEMLGVEHNNIIFDYFDGYIDL
jgi:ferredoxin-NADP reductase